MVAEFVRNPAVRHFMEHDGEYERRGHDNDFLYDTQFIHVPVSPGYYIEVEVEFDTNINVFKKSPLAPLFQKRGKSESPPLEKGD
jgi:hypothetical protein